MHYARYIIDSLPIGTLFELKREPENAVDPNAVLVMYGNHKMGYIPAEKAGIVAKYMDNGGSVGVRLLRKGNNDEYIWARIAVFKSEFPVNEDNISQLERLTKLFQDGALTTVEFEEQKRMLLNATNTQPKIPTADESLISLDSYTPRPALSEEPSLIPSWGKWFVGAVGVLMVFALIQKCNQNEQSLDGPATSTSSVDTITSTNYHYTILSETHPGSFANYEILVDSSITEMSQVMVLSAIFEKKECSEVPCNVIGMWNSERAFSLWQNKSDSPKWRKRNWPFLCEHYVAEYNATVKETNLFSFIDDEYRKWGGKKKRPTLNSIQL